MCTHGELCLDQVVQCLWAGQVGDLSGPLQGAGGGEGTQAQVSAWAEQAGQ
jgi:hypothetical protein